jgi:hypothetical protein
MEQLRVRHSKRPILLVCGRDMRHAGSSISVGRGSHGAREEWLGSCNEFRMSNYKRMSIPDAHDFVIVSAGEGSIYGYSLSVHPAAIVVELRTSCDFWAFLSGRKIKDVILQ